MCSCGTTYYDFYQVYDVKTVDEKAPVKRYNGGLLFENDDCAVLYSFWGDGGSASYELYNKTDDYMYVDLSKCFFIKNGYSYEEYGSRSWTNTATSASAVGTSSSLAYSGRMGYYYGGTGKSYSVMFNPFGTAIYNPSVTVAGSVNSTSYSSQSSSVSVKEQPIVTIPPKTSKMLGQYKINDSRLKFCSMPRLPKDSCQISFTEDQSPIRFSNYISYKIGDAKEYKNVNNGFYVYRITNYTYPALVKPVKRVDQCSGKEKKSGLSQIYDMYIKFDTSSSFYYHYSEPSSTSLYKSDYRYVDYVEGWLKNNGW